MSRIRLAITTLCIVIVVMNVCGKSVNNLEKGHKRVARSSKTNNEEFEKFFLKASKSVPRIGRRGFFAKETIPENYLNDLQSSGYPVNLEKRYGNAYRRKTPLWANIADIYEYNPDLPSSPDILSALDHDQIQGDDPSAYDWNKIQFKRGPNQQNKDNF